MIRARLPVRLGATGLPRRILSGQQTGQHTKEATVPQVRGVLCWLTLVAAVATGCGSSSKPAATPSGGSSSSGSSASSSVATEPPTPATFAHADQPAPAPPGAISEPMLHDMYLSPALAAKAGRVVIDLVNQDTLAQSKHDFRLTDSVGHNLATSATVQPLQEGVFVVDDVPAGNYLFVCTFHAMLGMKGTLTVS
jgi:Cupredoxin-like domain